MIAADKQARNADAKAKIFISYSRKDRAFADRLEAALKARGFEPLIDREEIFAFEDWWTRIEALIARADTVVFVLSPDAVASQVALKEVAHAASLNKRFAPIVCRQVDDSAVPKPLRRLNFIFFDDPARFDASADALAAALQTDIGWIRQHTEYGEAERRWSATGRPGGLLLRSPTLEVAEHWSVSRPRGAPEPTQEIQAFIGASRQGVRAAQRFRRLVQAFVYTLLVGIILGLVSWINQSYIAEQWRWLTVERPFVAANIWPFVLKPEAEQALKPGSSFRECASEQSRDYCPEMIVVPAGSFMMGSPATEKDRHDDEGPLHAVTIVKPFAVSKLELTFDEWDTCVADGDCPQGVSDTAFGRGQQPVINVSFDDAQRYVAWLSKVTGKMYRLLSEAEYEYAARAGTTTAYPWGNEIGKNNANCIGCGSRWDNKQTAPSGSFPPNQFGLYDMAGNVWQWLEDCDHQNYDGAPTDGSAWIESADCRFRIVRGGSWNSDPDTLRSAKHGRLSADLRFSFLGFRVGRTLLAP
jgi:formylglycine-generating enzyme required for sulfatase activity